MSVLVIRALRGGVVLIAALALLPSLLAGQVADSATLLPEPVPEDVVTVDGILAAVYASISGPAGQPRDWERFRSVMHPQARLMPSGPRGVSVRTVDEYIRQATPSLQGGGFFENEIGRRSDRYGNIVHLMSAYESLRTAGGEPFARGVNSFQLFFDGARWWVMSILWEQETPQNPIPKGLVGDWNRGGRDRITS